MDGPISDDGCSDTVTREPLNDANNHTCHNSNSGNAITRNPPSTECSGSQGVQHVRTTVPLAWGIALDHVTADLRITKAEALRESIAMFLRFHGRG